MQPAEAPAAAGAVRSSELLGFPRDARVLVVNCDDLGMYHAVNAAVVASIEQGIATSCSLMAPCPAASDALQLLRERPAIPFGVHLTLLRDGPHHRWGPLTAKELVPSLLDEAGELFTNDRIPELFARARLDDVERELRAQIGAVVDAGLAPTHLDWHCLGDGGRADVLDLTLSLASEYGLAVRVWLDPGDPRRQRLRRRGLPVTDNGFLDSFRLDLDGKAERYAELLRALPSGLSEWAVHPGLGDEESWVADPRGWRVRRTDYEFLISPEAREVVRQEGIVLIDYRTFQQVWSRVGHR
jgi:predicted glycoside hydrolase/deacetylase ChbG (UPF0249 family)